MTPATVIREAHVDGVILTVSDTGTLKANGDEAAVSRWLPAIREHKAEIIDALKVVASDTATACRVWLLTLPTGESFETHCTPPATRAEVLEGRPTGTMAERQ